MSTKKESGKSGQRKGEKKVKKEKANVVGKGRLWVPGQRSLASRRFGDKTKYQRKPKHPKGEN